MIEMILNVFGFFLFGDMFHSCFDDFKHELTVPLYFVKPMLSKRPNNSGSHITDLLTMTKMKHNGMVRNNTHLSQFLFKRLDIPHCIPVIIFMVRKIRKKKKKRKIRKQLV